MHMPASEATPTNALPYAARLDVHQDAVKNNIYTILDSDRA